MDTDTEVDTKFEYYEDFCKKDEMMKVIYKNFVEEKHAVHDRDIINIARFFGLFALGCRRLKCDSVSDMMDKRLSAFHWILHDKLGKKFGSRRVGKKTFGLDDIYEQAFGIARLGVGSARLIH